MSLDREHRIAIAERLIGMLSTVPLEGGPSRTLEEILAHIRLGEEVDPDEDVRRRAQVLVAGSDISDEEWLHIEKTLNARTVDELLDSGGEESGATG